MSGSKSGAGSLEASSEDTRTGGTLATERHATTFPHTLGPRSPDRENTQCANGR